MGRDADGSFKIEAFRKVADQVNERPTKGVLKDGEACRDHYTLKRWWAAISDLVILWVEGCLRLSHAGIILETCTSVHTQYKAAVLGRQKDRLKGSAIHNLLALTY